MRKPVFCICENKDADQLRSNCAADQRFCFRYSDSTIPLLSKSEIYSPVCVPEDRFSHNEAHICVPLSLVLTRMPTRLLNNL